MAVRGKLPEEHHEVDVCVIGGGMAGLAAALAAARHGARVLLMQERPVLGGNASSEIRMHICGADRHNTLPNLRETGILEELRLENNYRNPQRSYSLWDLLLYEKAAFQPGLTLLLNCSCLDAVMEGEFIRSVTGWQQTTQTFHTVEAKIFIDCSGDAILAPLTGALYRQGREGREEFGESIAPPQADQKTMGMTCMFHAQRYATPQPFTPPPWAYRYPHDEDLPYGAEGHQWFAMGYWWIELGGEMDSIRDTERLRDELLKIVMGVWDHIKNHGDHGAENWALDWLQFLPGKRESRRYVGEYILTQRDIEAGGQFPDVVAYGGWPMDDHHPAGFRAARLGFPATVFHPAPSPYGIPYRILYSRNIPNLMFAGRNVSCTHAALSSTRVMGTCCVLGQAAGTAAALAIAEGLTPKQVGSRIETLQQMLLADDCYLPGIPQRFSALVYQARLTASQGDPEPLRDGINRPVGSEAHAWSGRPGDYVAYYLPQPHRLEKVTLVVDTALAEDITLTHLMPQPELKPLPACILKRFRVEGIRAGKGETEAQAGGGDPGAGEWELIARVENNYQRLVHVPVQGTYVAVRVVLEETWGAEETRLYAFSFSEGD